MIPRFSDSSRLLSTLAIIVYIFYFLGNEQEASFRPGVTWFSTRKTVDTAVEVQTRLHNVNERGRLIAKPPVQGVLEGCQLSRDWIGHMHPVIEEKRLVGALIIASVWSGLHSTRYDFTSGTSNYIELSYGSVERTTKVGPSHLFVKVDVSTKLHVCNVNNLESPGCPEILRIEPDDLECPSSSLAFGHGLGLFQNNQWCMASLTLIDIDTQQPLFTLHLQHESWLELSDRQSINTTAPALSSGMDSCSMCRKNLGNAFLLNANAGTNAPGKKDKTLIQTSLWMFEKLHKALYAEGPLVADGILSSQFMTPEGLEMKGNLCPTTAVKAQSLGIVHTLINAGATTKDSTTFLALCAEQPPSKLRDDIFTLLCTYSKGNRPLLEEALFAAIKIYAPDSKALVKQLSFHVVSPSTKTLMEAVVVNNPHCILALSKAGVCVDTPESHSTWGVDWIPSRLALQPLKDLSFSLALTSHWIVYHICLENLVIDAIFLREHVAALVFGAYFQQKILLPKSFDSTALTFICPLLVLLLELV
ncbi:hypothetical protein Pelo_5066 [Pelomyxa schiedti]|nr:hypothetical protein Pelo_5066 [Pelomyxa schiedti]